MKVVYSLCLLSLGPGIAIPCAGQIPEKPNIILIISDDQGWGDTELNGNSVIDTPNLNRIASSGLQFERFFVSPMCAPTRASLMTGRYNLRTGVSWVCGRTEYLNLGETILPEILLENGYATACFGKWHLGEHGPYHPIERGFEEFFGFLQGGTANYFRSSLNYNGKNLTSDGYITDVLTDSAINYINDHQKDPFFCYISYNVPHHPFQAPENYFIKYKEKGIEDDKTASVYGMIDNMDENIGRILSKLDELKLTENTILIFISDNGPAFQRYNDGLSGLKAQVGEGSVRVPFYLSWKNHFPENKKLFQTAAHIDILPTLLDITNISIPDSIEVDGISLLPMIEEDKGYASDRVIYTHQSDFRDCGIYPGGLRTDRYRFLKWNEDYELFDMLTDPSQKRNIATEKPDLTSDFIEKYETWYYEVTSEGINPPPVPVGYPGYDTVKIIASSAVISGNLDYSGKWGCIHDWITNWTQPEDKAVWELDLYSEGTYSITLEYNCLPEDIGKTFNLSGEKRTLSAKIEADFFSERIALPNNVNKFSPGIRKWATLNFGEVRLEKGKQNLTLHLKEGINKSGIEIMSLTIVKKKGKS